MSKKETMFVVALRIALGILFFYAGITKVLNPEWSPAGYLNGAQTFSSFYAWLASPSNLPWVTLLNEWGLTLIGATLILGLVVRFSSLMGALLMLLYFFPGLSFPHVDHGYLVDDHIIYIICFGLLYYNAAGRVFGLDKYLRKYIGQGLYRSFS